jgi:hypothetical protein
MAEAVGIRPQGGTVKTPATEAAILFAGGQDKFFQTFLQGIAAPVRLIQYNGAHGRVRQRIPVD